MARLSFPEHEAHLPWLAALLEAYAGVKKKGERRKRTKQGGQHRVAKVVQQQDRTKLTTRMDQQAQQQQ